jgi:tRNA(fMet)-specific endonuclease VapC
MPVRYLLDTNTCIAAMRGHPKVVQRMAAVPPGECAVSTITSYELYTGVEKSTKPAVERAKVELLLKTVVEQSFENGAAKEAARIRALLQIPGPTDRTIRRASGRSGPGW